MDSKFDPRSIMLWHAFELKSILDRLDKKSLSFKRVEARYEEAMRHLRNLG